MKLILASSSVHRKLLLDQLGLTYSVVSPDVNEEAQGVESAAELAERLAVAKARAVARGLRDPALVIGADQSAALDGRHLEKPGSLEAAEQQLRLERGRTVTFCSGLCLLNSATGRCQSTVEICRVTFRHLSNAQIRAYVAAERPLDAVGAFKAESLGIALFESIQSSDPTTLIGLPLIRLVSFLANEGVDVFTS